MSIQWGIAMAMMTAPFALVMGLLWLTRVICEKSEAGVVRQIALTDARRQRIEPCRYEIRRKAL